MNIEILFDVFACSIYSLAGAIVDANNNADALFGAPPAFIDANGRRDIERRIARDAITAIDTGATLDEALATFLPYCRRANERQARQALLRIIRSGTGM